MTDLKPIGLYIHIPFCRSKCPYCDFYSFVPKGTIKEDYTKAICSRLDSENRIFDTVYFGGGTPSFLGENNLCEILSHIKTTENCEITLECNPSDTGSEERDFDFKSLSESGIYRISMGLQSGNEDERKILGRKSGCNEINLAIKRANDAGISNISLDLMIGIPGQTPESLDSSIDFCVSSGAKHISAYMLKVEENTYFGKNRDRIILPDDDDTADFYLQMVSSLKKYGFNQYEISNFSIPGYESRHNTKYWRLDEYLGLGPAAHSYINGKRFYYNRNIEEFINGGLPINDGDGGTCEEFIMLSLRLTEGLNFEKFQDKFGFAIEEKCKTLFGNLVSHNLAVIDKEHIFLTPEGFLISNNIICDICSEAEIL